MRWRETGNWDLILRFIYQVPYGQNDPLFGKDIGFYLFSLPAYVALKNWMLLMLLLEQRSWPARCTCVHGDINLDTPAVGGFRPPPSPTAPRCWVSFSR